MQSLICPNCGKSVPANKINIQKLVAVCPDCSHVFNFEASLSASNAQKNKRRKMKRPQHLSLSETPEGLTLAFRTNFRLDQDSEVINALSLSGIFGMITLLLLFGTRGLVGAIPFALIALFGVYLLALRTYNKTYIHMSEDLIRVKRAPLPNPLQYINEVNLYDVAEIRYEETAISKEKQYDTPRYRVFAVTEAGTERLIVNDVIENYAVYIATTLERYLHDTQDEEDSYDEIAFELAQDIAQDTPNTARLLDDIDLSDDDAHDNDAHDDDAHDDDDLPSIGGLTQA